MSKENHFRQPKIYATTPREKKYYLSRRFVLIVVLCIISVLLIWFLFFSSYFKIKKIIISGSLNPEVEAEINRFQGKNILLFRTAKVEKNLAQKQTSIASLEIYKGIPDILKVKVNVRIPKIAWQSGDKTYLIDKKGVVFELGQGTAVTERGEPIPTIVDTKEVSLELGRQIVTEYFVKFILDLTKDFSAKIGANIQAIKIGETTFQIEVETDQGWRVYLDTTRDLNNQLTALRKILDQYRDQIHEYVDLRVEGRAYYK